jgi:hypothetical protein
MGVRSALTYGFASGSWASRQARMPPAIDHTFV